MMSCRKNTAASGKQEMRSREPSSGWGGKFAGMGVEKTPGQLWLRAGLVSLSVCLGAQASVP